MTQTNRLSPMTTYYLRKLIEDKQETLQKLAPELQEKITLEALLARAVRRHASPHQSLGLVESLVQLHKNLVSSYAAESSQIQELELRIFMYLGADSQEQSSKGNDGAETSSLSMAKDCLNSLNTLRDATSNYLGATLVQNYLVETRPHHSWCQLFKIVPKAKISYDGHPTDILSPEQVTTFEQWINGFTERCCRIVADLGRDENSDQGESLFSMDEDGSISLPST